MELPVERTGRVMIQYYLATKRDYLCRSSELEFVILLLYGLHHGRHKGKGTSLSEEMVGILGKTHCRLARGSGPHLNLTIPRQAVCVAIGLLQDMVGMSLPLFLNPHPYPIILHAPPFLKPQT